MSGQTFPTFVDQPGCTIRNMSIVTDNVGATAGTAGLDGRGQFLCTISVSAGTYTINWLQAFGDRPYVHFQPTLGATNTLVQILTSTSSTLTFNMTESDDNTAPLTTGTLDVTVFSYNTTSFVS